MRDKHTLRILLSGFSPWIIIGAAAVLLPIVAMMTMENINRQKTQSIRVMMAKGAALIRSFEAGTRMGMRGDHGSGFRLQHLLEETAAQPDIAYLFVVAVDGTVIAHSQSERVGTHFAGDLDLRAVYASGSLAWRRTETADDVPVFEVYGRFAPLGRRFQGPPHGRLMRMMEPRPAREAPPPMVIFVGFKTDDFDAARAADVRHTVIMAVVLLLAGCAGVLLLFMAQHYREARTSLGRVKAFSDNLVARMPIGLVALDREGRVTAINSVAESTLAIRAVAAIGRPAAAVLPEILARTLADTADPVEKELRCPLADGRRIPLDVSAASLEDADGRRFGKVILFKDLSEIRQLRQELEKNRRLASVGRLAAGVAHEIRNPLSSIKGFATYFKEKYQTEERDQEIATVMIQEVDRLNRVVGQLLEFSRPMRLHFQRLRLKPFLEDALRLVAHQYAEAGIDMVLEAADDRLAVMLDTDKMNQVMLNVFLNAKDAMPDGGRLTLQVSAGDGERITIRISDTGTGIDPDDLPHVFEPYFSTKRSGTGLGLAIVHNIIAAHEGEIVVDSQRGQGTTIQIILPAAGEE